MFQQLTVRQLGHPAFHFISIKHHLKRYCGHGFAGLLSLVGVTQAFGQAYEWTTVAGSIGGVGFRDGAVGIAQFKRPKGVASDAKGIVYLADTGNHAIRKIAPEGMASTFAGKGGLVGTDDGTGDRARFNGPVGLALDGAGNLYVADTGNHAIRKISPAGAVTTLAGAAGVAGYHDATGNAARFCSPEGIAAGPDGDMFVADTGNHVIRRIAADGAVTTIAGQAGVPGAVDGGPGVATFSSPRALGVDDEGSLYIADTGNGTIRKITSDGNVATLAGMAGAWDNIDGIGSAARFFDPQGIVVDAARNVYVTDTSCGTIRCIAAADAMVTTLAGNLEATDVALIDGTGSSAQFYDPVGIALANDGDLLVADSSNQALRKVTPDGVATTLIANRAAQSGANDAVATSARFNKPLSLTVDRDANLYIADTGNFTIRKIAIDGAVTTVAGSAGVSATVDATGPAARFGSPVAVAMSPGGILHVADRQVAPRSYPEEDLIRKIGTDGAVTTLAGRPGSLPNTETLLGLTALAFDAGGNLFATDLNAIHMITPAGQANYLMGGKRFFITESSGYHIFMFEETPKDGGWGNALVANPNGIAVDASGNFYLTQGSSYAIRKMIPYGNTSTVAGVLNGKTSTGSTDGTGSVARFNLPKGIAVDSADNLYVADSGNHTIRRVSAFGVVTTIGGIPGYAGNDDGVGDRALFNQPSGMSIDAAGNLYVADTLNHRVVKGTPLPAPAMVLERADGTHLASGGQGLAFGSTPPGGSSGLTATLKLWNVGTTALEITGWEILGDEAVDFPVELPGPTFSIAPGACTSALVTFRPSALGARSATLQIRSNDSNNSSVAINLNGTGNTLPVFSGYSFSTTAGTPAVLALAKLLAAASDPDGFPLTLAPMLGRTAASGNIELLTDSIRYTPPALPFVGADHFQVTYTDAQGGTVTGSVTVTVTAATAGVQAAMAANPPKLTWLAGGGLSVGFHGIPGRLYQIQRSLDLASWQTLASTNADATGLISFTDKTPPQPTAYYRLALP